MSYRIEPLNEESIIVTFLPQTDASIHKKVQLLNRAIHEQPFNGLIETVPAYHSVTLHFEPIHEDNLSPFQFVKKHLIELLSQSKVDEAYSFRKLKIPVCYDPRLGEDLITLSKELHLTIEEVIQIHSGPLYEVVFIGFSPGFPFLSGLDERIAFPRKSSPRLKIDPGSVGIAGNQTGIYSVETPGGWNIIGKTPITLFESNKPSPSFFKVGDRLKFVPISFDNYTNWKENSWVFEF
ncbi:5-oxoprolinase subunit PxpB [Bacillus carboniphilus]|uniref:5-oxoprolinase subunit PxpB n=1 Tax=Bacillus carboniphilus TaxID=86663 RepID=A0ABP3FXC5_9BACI